MGRRREFGVEGKASGTVAFVSDIYSVIYMHAMGGVGLDAVLVTPAGVLVKQRTS